MPEENYLAETQKASGPAFLDPNAVILLPHQRREIFIRELLKGFPTVTYDEVTSPGKRRDIVRARCAIVRALQAAEPNLTIRKLAALFSVSDTTINEITRPGSRWHK